MTVAQILPFGPPTQAADRLGVSLAPQLSGAVASRQFEFIAGRVAAVRALRDCGFGGAIELPMAPGRAPAWPVHYVGSIAHSHGYVWSVVAPQSRLDALGIDLERLLDDDAAVELAPAVMQDGELAQARCTGQIPGAFGAKVTLIFSAKEALYKCLNPLLEIEFDFHDLVVTSVDHGNGRLQLRLARDLAPDFGAGREFAARFEIEADMVRTVVELARLRSAS